MCEQHKILETLELLGFNRKYIGSISISEKYCWYNSSIDNNVTSQEIIIECYNLKMSNDIKQIYGKMVSPNYSVKVLYCGDLSENNISRPGKSAWCKMTKQEQDDCDNWIKAIKNLNK